jgi:alkylation response protein AidB-like acyl-CoA dehydrogenase
MEIIGLNAEEQKFKHELEEFLEKECSREVFEEGESGSGPGPYTWEVLRKLGAKGWLAPTWPREYGGLELPPTYRYIVRQVTSYMGILFDLPGTSVSLDMVGPVMLQLGSEEMKKEFLPRMAHGEIEFGIGYTEPQAGSDLSAIETYAEEDGDEYVINGHKIFNSCLQFASYQWCCVRTDRNLPRHKGLSIFIIDLSLPGITVKPLFTVQNKRTNEIFYDGLRVPKKYLFGEKNKGWYYMMAALNVERTEPSGQLERMFDELMAVVKETSIGGNLLSKDPLVRQKMAQLAIEVNIARKVTRRMVGAGESLSIDAAANHLFYAELTQRLCNTAMQVMGHYGSLQKDSRWVKARGIFERHARVASTGAIGGGSSEVMRTILAARGLGMPRGS